MKVGLTVAFMAVALTVVACSSLDPLEEQRVETLEIDSVDFPAGSGNPFYHRYPTVRRSSWVAG